jgi:hypothetical protein
MKPSFKGSKDKKGGFKGKDKRPAKRASQKRPRSEEEDRNPHAAASRANQFRETKLHRKAAKPDNELVDMAKVIYNVVKPNDVSAITVLVLCPLTVCPLRRR